MISVTLTIELSYTLLDVGSPAYNEEIELKQLPCIFYDETFCTVVNYAGRADDQKVQEVMEILGL